MYTSCSTYQLLELNIREEVRTLEKGQEIVSRRLRVEDEVKKGQEMVSRRLREEDEVKKGQEMVSRRLRVEDGGQEIEERR